MFYLLLILCTVSSHHITINNNSSDSIACLEGAVPCQSLEYISYHLKNVSTGNVTLEIISSSLTVREVVSFTGIDGLTLLGHGMESTLITCLTETSKKGMGLRFYNCSRLTLADFTINNCGYQIDPKSPPLQYGAISVKNLSNVKVLGLNITNSTGRGLAMIDVMGIINIVDSVFSGNGNSIRTSYQGGLVIVLRNNSTVKVLRCTFLRNIAKITDKLKAYKNKKHGGGALIIFRNYTSNNRIIVNESLFEYNYAEFGAGLKLLYEGGSSSNIISIAQCTFNGNNASVSGGGLDVGAMPLTESNTDFPSGNRIIILECNFTSNAALFGGGLGIYASDGLIHSLKIESCNFSNNSAIGGSAVSISYNERKTTICHEKILIEFHSCVFMLNYAGSGRSRIGTVADVTQSGTIFTGLSISLFGNNTLRHNNGTGIYSSFATINFTEGSLTNFSNNIGEKGGAILLVGTASLNIEPNSFIHFENNKALFGGAICSMLLEKHYYGYVKSCFISSVNSSQVFISFKGNKAISGIANDIFLANLKGCQTKCTEEKVMSNITFEDIFTTQCIGSMSFTDRSIATATTNISLEQQISPYPGIPYQVNVKQFDSFGNDVSQLFPLTVSFLSCCEIVIDPGYVILNNNVTKLYGRPSTSGILLFQGYTNTNVQAFTNVTLSYCPPGYIMNNNTCTCSADSEDKKLKGVLRCSSDKLVVLQMGVWAGYLDDSHQELMTGYCKVGLCSMQNVTKPRSLDNVCSKYRDGVLCSRCKANYTLQYHSNTYLCKEISKSHCKYGILLYLVSELLPVTIIFMIILILNVNITSGAVNTFIFCAQLISSLLIDTFEVRSIAINNQMTATFFSVYRVVFGLLNFSIFEGDRLSFCLFKGATLMDLFLVKYFTVLYAFFLVVATIIILRLNSIYVCIKLCYKCGYRNVHASVIHGLTAFLVLCYFQCARMTFKILVSSSITRAGGATVSTRLIYAGDIKYMSSDHLPYAIPAIICLVVVILPPPIILSLEPLLVRLSGAVNIRRNAFTFCLHRLRMKLKPFLDSFQGCFRDNCRSFSGLFFFYRVIILSFTVASTSIEEAHLEITLVLFFICILHGLIRPYQKKWHNYVDLLLLGNITAVNMLTTVEVYIDYLDYSPNHQIFGKFALLVCQMVLVSLFFIYICLYFVHYVLRKHFNCQLKRQSRITFGKMSPTLDESLPMRLYEESMLARNYGATDDSDID